MVKDKRKDILHLPNKNTDSDIRIPGSMSNPFSTSGLRNSIPHSTWSTFDYIHLCIFFIILFSLKKCYLKLNLTESTET